MDPQEAPRLLARPALHPSHPSHRARQEGLLLVREENKGGGITLPFLCFGFAGYMSTKASGRVAIR
jgi:hypothetical protein